MLPIKLKSEHFSSVLTLYLLRAVSSEISITVKADALLSTFSKLVFYH